MSARFELGGPDWSVSANWQEQEFLTFRLPTSQDAVWIGITPSSTAVVVPLGGTSAVANVLTSMHRTPRRLRCSKTIPPTR